MSGIQNIGRIPELKRRILMTLALLAVYWQGRSMDEIADVLGLTRNALYKLLYDARRRLKAALSARHLSVGDILAAFED